MVGGEKRAEFRALAGLSLGSGLVLVLAVAGPQALQVGDNAWPAAVAASLVGAYLGGFIGNHPKPRQWPVLLLGGWAVGTLAIVVVAFVFGSSGD